MDGNLSRDGMTADLESMQHLVASSVEAKGPLAFDGMLPRPEPLRPCFDGAVTGELAAGASVVRNNDSGTGSETNGTGPVGSHDRRTARDFSYQLRGARSFSDFLRLLPLAR